MNRSGTEDRLDNGVHNIQKAKKLSFYKFGSIATLYELYTKMNIQMYTKETYQSYRVSYVF